MKVAASEWKTLTTQQRRPFSEADEADRTVYEKSCMRTSVLQRLSVETESQTGVAQGADTAGRQRVGKHDTRAKAIVRGQVCTGFGGILEADAGVCSVGERRAVEEEGWKIGRARLVYFRYLYFL